MPQPARCHETRVTIPYCRPGEADRLPPLIPECTPRGKRVYPYALQELVGEAFEPAEFRAVILENDHLELTFLPELGGRLIGMVDKKNGRELLFRNPVLKPVMAGLTGAWNGIGMEFNFPGSHSVTSDRPVTCRMKENADGSAAVTISDRELISGMVWRVTVTLKRDSEAVFIDEYCGNRTALPHPGYWWTNAKVPAYGDTEFVFPARCGHGVVHPPMDTTRIAELELPRVNQTDIRRYRSVYFQLPLFFLGLRSETFGVYHRDKGFGLLQHADFGRLPGRKIWTLGTGDDGKVVNENLTLDGAPNIEIQSGPLPIQTDFLLLNPGEERSWREHFLPVRELLERHLASSPDFTVSAGGGMLRIQCHRAQRVELESGGERHAFQAETGKSHDFPLLAGEENFTLRHVDGWVLLEFGAVSSSLPGAAPLPVPEGAEAEYLRGRYCEEHGKPAAAEEHYRRALAIDGSYTAALKALGRRKLERGYFSAALPLLDAALAKNRRDPEASYYYALAAEGCGDVAEARFHFERARCDGAWRPAASARLAGLYFRLKRRSELMELLADPRTAGCEELLEIAALHHQLTGSGDAGAVERLRELAPENPLPELLAGNTPELTDPRQAGVIAALLRNLGLPEEARSVARRYAAADPVLAGLGGDIAALEAQPVAGIFPPPGTAEALEALRAEHPQAARLHYYCGVLRAAAGDWEGAVSRWNRSRELGSSDPELFRNLGLYHWKIVRDPKQAACFYEAGFHPETATYKYFYEFDQVLELLGEGDRRQKLLAALPEKLQSNPYVTIRRAFLKLEGGDARGALAELAGRRFVLCEGKRMTGALFITANLRLGEELLAAGDSAGALEFFERALSYPHELGVGRSSGNFDMKTKFLILKALHLAGRADECTRRREEFLDECDRLAIDMRPLESIRWESGAPAPDDLLRENEQFLEQIRACEYAGNQTFAFSAI